jgi:hypothetical protein
MRGELNVRPDGAVISPSASHVTPSAVRAISSRDPELYAATWYTYSPNASRVTDGQPAIDPTVPVTEAISGTVVAWSANDAAAFVLSENCPADAAPKTTIRPAPAPAPIAAMSRTPVVSPVGTAAQATAGAVALYTDVLLVRAAIHPAYDGA